jgi:hypothetical protein
MNPSRVWPLRTCRVDAHFTRFALHHGSSELAFNADEKLYHLVDALPPPDDTAESTDSAADPTATVEAAVVAASVSTTRAGDAGGVRMSACTDSIESTQARLCSQGCTAQLQAHNKAMQICLDELVQSGIVTVLELAQYYFGWFPGASISKESLKKFRRLLLHAQ